MDTDSLVLRSRRVVTPEGVGAAAVWVRDGTVAAVLPVEGSSDLGALPAGARGAPLVDLGEDALLPGLVDTHVHVNEPGRTEWEGFACATRAAAAGGVTTLLDMPLNSVPPTVSAVALEAKRRAAGGQAHVDAGFWGGAVPGNQTAMVELHAAGAFGFKAFLTAPGVEEFTELDARTLRRALSVVAELGSVLLVHAEDPTVLSAAPLPHGLRYRGWLDSRPPEAERAAVARVAALAEETGARAHVVHLSAAEALAPLRAARARGVRLTAETCPHYLCLTAEEIPDGATQYKCAPPIRGAANREALWAALADGTLDMVVSDHSPCPAELKRGDFATAWGGVSSLQLGLPAVWTEARRRGHTLQQVAAWMATAPAALAGLPRKGAIAPGRDADLVAFATDASFAVDPGGLHHRHPLTPYAGRTLTGIVRRTWLRGVEVHPGDGRPRGLLLQPDR